MFHVKHRSGSGHVPFHVKHFVNRSNEGPLLSDTEFAEDDIEDVFDVDPTEQSAKGIRRSPELLGRELFALTHNGDRPAQRVGRILDEHPLALPRDQSSLASAEIALRETHQRLDQFGQAYAAPGGNPELGHWPTLGVGRSGAW